MMITNSIDKIILVNRVEYLQILCNNKSVLHLGATDAPFTKKSATNGELLHFMLGKVSKKLIGLDCDLEMISWLAEHFGVKNIKHGNIENLEDYPQNNFDVILAGEIFEHLSNPGKALDSIRSIISPTAKLVITVPNAYSVKGFLRAIARHELIHPDHTLHHSPHTLKSLLERHGFKVIKYFSYVNGGKGVLAEATNLVIRFNPQLAEGLGIIAQLK